MPKFSIMMPCYNAMETLDASIGSIVAQTRRDWELLCIDDGSDDGTLARLQSWLLQINAFGCCAKIEKARVPLAMKG